MNSAIRDSMIDDARRRAAQHPARLDIALAEGARQLQRRVLFAYASCIVVALVFALTTIGVQRVIADEPGTDQVGAQVSDSALTPTASPEPTVGNSTKAVEPTVDSSQTPVTDRSVTPTVSVTGAPVPTVTGLRVLPAEASLEPGEQLAVSALASYSDGSSADVSDRVSWASSDAAVATVDESGVVTAVESGDASIAASVGGAEAKMLVTVSAGRALTGVGVSPGEVTASVGGGEQLTATATYSDQSTEDVTGAADWQVDDPGVATVGAGGSFECVAVGTTTVRALFDGQVGEAALGCLLTLDVTPDFPNADIGDLVILTATARTALDDYPDVTTEALWESKDKSIAVVDNKKGYFRCVGLGEVGVTASYGGVVASELLAATPRHLCENFGVPTAAVQ